MTVGSQLGDASYVNTKRPRSMETAPNAQALLYFLHFGEARHPEGPIPTPSSPDRTIMQTQLGSKSIKRGMYIKY